MNTHYNFVAYYYLKERGFFVISFSYLLISPNSCRSWLSYGRTRQVRFFLYSKCHFLGKRCHGSGRRWSSWTLGNKLRNWSFSFYCTCCHPKCIWLLLKLKMIPINNFKVIICSNLTSIRQQRQLNTPTSLNPSTEKNAFVLKFWLCPYISEEAGDADGVTLNWRVYCPLLLSMVFM